jgi:hypothetical protein
MDLSEIEGVGDISRNERLEYSYNYRQFSEMSYLTECLWKFQKSLVEIVYTLDNRTDNKDFIAALRFIVDNEMSTANFRSQLILKHIDDALRVLSTRVPEE